MARLYLESTVGSGMQESQGKDPTRGDLVGSCPWLSKGLPTLVGQPLSSGPPRSYLRLRVFLILGAWAPPRGFWRQEALGRKHTEARVSSASCPAWECPLLTWER